VAEAARLESVFRVKSNGGSNPPSSAKHRKSPFLRAFLFVARRLNSSQNRNQFKYLGQTAFFERVKCSHVVLIKLRVP
jgi:hypothetical protein